MTDKIQFPNAFATPYAKYQKIARTGDVWVESNKGLISSRIKAHTNSEITHVGLVLKIYGSRYLVETHHPDGVKMSLLSDKVTQAEGGVAIYRFNLDNWYYTKMVRLALAHVVANTPYDDGEILRQMRNTYREKIGLKPIAYEKNGKLMCYEFVAACLATGGVNLPEGGNPADVLKAGAKLVCVLKQI